METLFRLLRYIDEKAYSGSHCLGIFFSCYHLFFWFFSPFFFVSQRGQMDTPLHPNLFHVDLSRCSIPKGLMKPLVVVKLKITFKALLCLGHRLIPFQIDILVFHTSPKPLHSSIDLLTPDAVHYGQAEQTQNARGAILRAAYEAHPERFVRKCPVPPSVPVDVWINKPKPTPVSEEAIH